MIALQNLYTTIITYAKGHNFFNKLTDKEKTISLIAAGILLIGVCYAIYKWRWQVKPQNKELKSDSTVTSETLFSDDEEEDSLKFVVAGDLNGSILFKAQFFNADKNAYEEKELVLEVKGNLKITKSEFITGQGNMTFNGIQYQGEFEVGKIINGTIKTDNYEIEIKNKRIVKIGEKEKEVKDIDNWVENNHSQYEEYLQAYFDCNPSELKFNGSIEHKFNTENI